MFEAVSFRLFGILLEALPTLRAIKLEIDP